MTSTPPPGGGRDASNKLNELENLINQMRKEISYLKFENQQLKSKIANDSIQKEQKSISDKITYETDSDELNQETNWILKKRNRPSKKRKADASPEMEEIEESLNTDLKKKVNLLSSKNTELRPPPIMVSDVTDYKKFHSLLLSVVKNKFFIKIINNGIHKVSIFNPDDYRNATKTLSKEKIPWYSYENKQDRPIKVFVKNLHHSCEPAMIESNLEEQGLKVLNVVNKLKWKTKEPLDMFLLTFDSTEDVKKIYEIKTILNTVVKIEPIKSSNLIPQCKLCQSFGHTKNYCAKNPRCVKCTGLHSTNECQKSNKEKPKCCNCGETHPANYRGCIVAKQLQKIRDEKRKPKLASKENQMRLEGVHSNKSKISVETIQNQQVSQTYAQVLKEPTNISHETQNINSMLAKILEKLDSHDKFNRKLEGRLQNLESKMKTAHFKNA